MAEYTNAEKMKLDEEELTERLKNLEREELPTANIIVAGITGAGKSTLLNAIFGSELAATGKGRAVTSHMAEYGQEGMPVHIWDTVGLELDAEKTRQSILAIKGTISEKARSKDMFDRIHAIWYCINSATHKYQEAESRFIKELYSLGVPFIIVLTQCIEEQEEIDDFVAIIENINRDMGMDGIQIVQVCAMEYKMRGFTLPAFGLEDLVDATMLKLPDFIKSGFAAAQRVSKTQKRNQGEDVIYECVKKAKNGFWDRVPVANIIAANDRVLDMFKKIGKIYNTEISKEGLERITKECRIDWENTFDGLITPFAKKYYKKVMSKLKASKQDGFEVAIDDLKKSDRVAVMVAYYGYIYIDAIEEVWQKFTEEQLKDVQIVVDNLICTINRILRERS